MNVRSEMRRMAGVGAAVALALCAGGALAGDPAPGEMKERLRAMEQKARELKEAGKPEEAEAIIRQAREMHRKSMEQAPERRGEPAELARRLQHIREAANHLHAAGMEDAAERLSREADRMEEQLHAAKSMEHGEGTDRGEVERLRAEVKELQQIVRRLQARIEAERPRSDAVKP
jgi:hypothetical protein